jgi:hypothetical protein
MSRRFHSFRWAICLTVLLAHLAAGEAIQITPEFQRLDLQPADAVIHILTLTAPPGTTITGILADCACLRPQVQLPLPVPASGQVLIPMRVSGVRPGVEDMTITTTAGTAKARIQIVGPGAGTGLPVLTAAIKEAQEKHLSMWGVIHNLQG